MNLFSSFNSVFYRPLATPATEIMATDSVPSSSAPAVVSAPRIPGLMSIEDWEEQRSSRKLQNESDGPAPKKLKAASSSSVPGVPSISKPRGGFAARLNGLTQTHRLRAEYEFEEPLPQTFSARLTLLDLDQMVVAFETEATFANKKTAKEAVAEKGVGWLAGKETPKKLVKEASVSEPNVVDNSENWASILNEFCQQNHRPPAEFQVYDLEFQRFSATCTISGTTYGDTTTGYGSKKNAKAAAARAAVLGLRDLGTLTPRPSSSSTKPPATTPSVNPTPTTSTTTPATIPDLSPPATAFSRVNDLCNDLALTPPQYKFFADPEGSVFVSGAAYFKDALEPVLRKPVGVVERIYGKGNAREQCAKEVLVVLERVMQERLSK